MLDYRTEFVDGQYYINRYNVEGDKIICMVSETDEPQVLENTEEMRNELEQLMEKQVKEGLKEHIKTPSFISRHNKLVLGVVGSLASFIMLKFGTLPADFLAQTVFGLSLTSLGYGIGKYNVEEEEKEFILELKEDLAKQKTFLENKEFFNKFYPDLCLGNLDNVRKQQLDEALQEKQKVRTK